MSRVTETSVWWRDKKLTSKQIWTITVYLLAGVLLLLAATLAVMDFVAGHTAYGLMQIGVFIVTMLILADPVLKASGRNGFFSLTEEPDRLSTSVDISMDAFKKRT